MKFSIDTALAHLQSDPIMATLISNHQPPKIERPEELNLFAYLIGSIISQQLSVKVADVIEERVYKLLPGRQLLPSHILAMETEDLRACGVSYAKVKYMKSAAEAAVSGYVNFAKLPQLSDEDVIAELIKIHGVGRWTAEMLLIFGLHRPDVFSIGDLGLRTAVANLYRVERTSLPAIEAIASQWSPYRSLASRYLWKSLDNEPLQKSSL